jgi:hypothetical protein
MFSCEVDNSRIDEACKQMRAQQRLLVVAAFFVAGIRIAIAATPANTEPVPAKPIGMETVQAALVEAETAVKQAEAHRALWTSAEEALRRARRALDEGDAAEALRQAEVAKEQAAMGIAQKGYPLFR